MAIKGVARSALRRVVGPAAAGRLLNLYGDARTAVGYRVAADGRRSTRELRKLKDAYAGQRAFIIGNGPSLREMDLSPLRDEVTFGLNRIYLLFDKIGFATTFLVSVNTHVIEQCADELTSTRSQKIFSWRSRRHLGDASQITFVRSVSRPHFSLDPSRAVWEGATVTFVAMQLAYYMGFTEVILIGVDHQFAASGKPHMLVTSDGPDESHFDPNYFGKGFRWQLPDLETSEYAYGLAREAYERGGRRIVNATVGGRLEIFPRKSYDQVLADRSGARG
jgi:hypothetical protein